MPCCLLAHPYPQATGLPASTIAGVEDWVKAVRRPHAAPSSPASPSPSSERSPSREEEDLRLHCKELKRELARVRTELKRERDRREIAEAETSGLRETLRSHIPSKEEREKEYALL